jgi:hypothetical protein
MGTLKKVVRGPSNTHPTDAYCMGTDTLGMSAWVSHGFRCVEIDVSPPLP